MRRLLGLTGWLVWFTVAVNHRWWLAVWLSLVPWLAFIPFSLWLIAHDHARRDQ